MMGNDAKDRNLKDRNLKRLKAEKGTLAYEREQVMCMSHFLCHL